LLLAIQSRTQERIATAEHELDATETVSSDLQTLLGDIEDKKARLEKIKSDMKSSNYENKFAEKLTKGSSLEEQRAKLNSELVSLGLQADSRARLDLKRTEFKTKTADVRNTYVIHISMLIIPVSYIDDSLEAVNDKYHKLVGSDPRADSMEREIDSLLVYV
jgi:DNA repair protein RAD50